MDGMNYRGYQPAPSDTPFLNRMTLGGAVLAMVVMVVMAAGIALTLTAADPAARVASEFPMPD